MSPLKDGSTYARPTATKNTGKASSPTRKHVGGLRKKAAQPSRYHRSFRISKVAKDVYVADFFAVLVLLSMASMYVMIFHSGGAEISGGLQIQGSSIPIGHSSSIVVPHSHESNNGTIFSKENYEEFHQDAPECRPLEYYEVTFGLAIALKESELSLVSHQCRRWGISAPISIAVWTDKSPEQVMEKLQSFQKNECRPEQMTISTLSSQAASTTSETFPLNQLRNLAIRGLQTTYAVYLDVRVLPSGGLYDILHSPSTVQELAKDPRLAIVLPAFEVNKVHKKDPLKSVPDTFESLVMNLSLKKASIMGPGDIALQGSTLYRSWIQQDPGSLLSIDCVSSDFYEPFLAIRYCDGLPPFQEVLKHENNSNDNFDHVDMDDAKHDLTSTWILHLLRLGYSFEQIGGGFVVGLPSPSEAKAENGATIISNEGAASQSLRKNRNRKKRFTRQTFLKWLHQTVPDDRLMQKCDDFEASVDEID